MGLTSFDSDLGLYQGQVEREPGSPGAGARTLVLGHAQAGMFATLEPGDAVELAQDVVLAGDHAVVGHVLIRGPRAIPPGYEWRLEWFAGGSVLGRTIVAAGRSVTRRLAALVTGLGGPHELGLRLALGGPPGPVEFELPGVWVDDVALVQLQRPALFNPAPAPGEREVARTSTIQFELIDASGGGVDVAQTRVWAGSVLAMDAGQVQPAFAGPGAGAGVIPHGYTIALVPLAPFASQAHVLVQVTSQTLDGAGRLDTSYEFDVEDRTSPSLLAAFAPDLRQLELVFDEPVIAPSAATLRLVPETTPAVVPRVVSLETLGERVRVALDPPLSPRVRYRVEALGLTDASGNTVAAPFDRAWFQAGGNATDAASRFPLWGMLPRHVRRSDTGGDLRLFIACLQDVTDLLLAEGDRWLDILDLRRAPEPFLDLILADLGNPFPFALDLIGKRRLAATLVRLYRHKGASVGIEQALRFFFGLNARTLPYISRAARLGRARLGRDFRLGPSDCFRLYAFDLEVDRLLTDEERRQVRWLVEYAKPAHTHLVRIIEPTPLPPAGAWRLGSARLARTTVLATT